MRPNRTRREYLTADEVAAILGVSAQSVRRWAKKGELPAIRIGKLWRFDPAVIREVRKKGA